jgi:outer membrane protein OmpA-like peptidoglycan-associated protein
MSERQQEVKQSESSVAARSQVESTRPHRSDLPRRVAPSGLAALPQRLWQAGNRAVNRLLGRRDGGQPLAQQTRAEMERSFNADFSNVRVHDDGTAHVEADEIGAKAFTHGDDIYLADSASSPATVEGKRLLAHELAHVVQQRRAGGRQSDAINTLGDRFEADADKAAALAGTGRPVQVTATGAPPAVQRQPADESLGQKALDYILEKGVSYTDQGWKIGGIPIEKIPPAAKTAANVMAKILKGDLAGAVEIVNPKDPEEEKKAWEKVRRIKEEIDSLQPVEERARKKEEARRAEEEMIPKATREASKKLGLRPPDPKFEFKAPELKLSEGLRMGTITHWLFDDFDHEKSQLKSKHHRKLNDLADQVMADPDAELEIIGHTDSTGTDDFNQKLSKDRANAVRDYLIKRGVNPSKIKSVTGKAAREPWIIEKAEADRAANRRVEIFYKPGVIEKKKRGFGLPPLRLNR